LYPGYGYWVKVNQVGSMVLSSGSGLPCPGIPTVLYGGRTYNTVQIGSQCWLKENLDVGTMILGSEEQTDNGTIEKHCYDDNPVNCATYGGLYQWTEAMQYDTTQGAEGICPPGWHMPTLSEFQTLSSTVGESGNALKAIGQGTGGGAGTNASGFSALLAGIGGGGGFSSLGTYTSFWSSTQSDTLNEHVLSLNAYSAEVFPNVYGWYNGFSVRCLKTETPNSPPDAPSDPAPPDGSSGQSPSVMLGWSCADPDSDALTYDVYFASSNPPDTMVSSSQTGTTFGASGLSGATTYYWKVVARDTHADTTSGPVWSFTTGAIGGSPCPGTPTVAYAGKTYNTVQIGTQCWLRENLDMGSMVLGSQEQTDNDTIEKYCYDDDPANCAAYGGLYQWNEVMQYDTAQGAQGICPPGWHIPTLGEFQTLSATVGGDGNAIKAVGQGSGGGAGTNTSGFCALLAGCNMVGLFGNLGDDANFWSSTEYLPTYVHSLVLFHWEASIILSDSDKTLGFSMRCLMD
jgi:uncharacterized protein (TIGR02145 family)